MESVGGDESNRIGVLPPDIISQYSGLEVLKRMMNGELPLPAMSEIIPFRLTEVAADGRLVDRAGALYAHGTTTVFLFPGALSSK